MVILNKEKDINYSKWQTKDGNILDTSEMTIKHIKNCILYCKNGFKKFISMLPDNYEDLPEPNNNYKWFGCYAEDYIKVFEEELSRREQIK